MSVAARVRLLTASSLGRVRAFAGGLILALGVVGCAGEPTGSESSDNASLVGTRDGDNGLQPGWLLLDWSVAGDQQPEQCDRTQAATVALTVGAASAESQRVYQTTCFAFNTTVQLAPGDYTARAVLLDGAGTELTAPVALEPFEVSSGVPVHAALEFPSSAFYGR